MIDLVPGNRYALLGQLSTQRLQAVDVNSDGVYWLDLLDPDGRVTITTTNPAGWLDDDGRDPVDEFSGFRLGDLVHRGKGATVWEITGLSIDQGPAISLQSVPDHGKPPQNRAVFGQSGIAQLVPVEDDDD